MPAISDLRFALDDGFDCGVAYLLVQPPESDTSETYSGGHLLASPSSPYVIVRFHGAASRDQALLRGSELLQQALDLHSMLGRADLHVKEAPNEFMTWWTDAGKHHLFLANTVTFSAKIGPIHAVVRDAQGNIVPQSMPSPRHHRGFRFYRLSQVTEDLYDAFRNMYLAFESLLSSKYPKTKEQEIQWLTRGLVAASQELQLANLCPGGTIDHVRHLLSKIYTESRLPLFHAKDGKTYFAPGESDADRAAVQEALSTLTALVIRMAGAWFSAPRRGGWVNLSVLDEGYRSTLTDCEMVYSDVPTDLKDEALNASMAAAGLPFQATVNEDFSGARRTNITASMPASALALRTHLSALYIVKDGKPLIGVTPDTVVDVTGFDDIHACIFLRGRNANQPKSQFAR